MQHSAIRYLYSGPRASGPELLFDNRLRTRLLRRRCGRSVLVPMLPHEPRTVERAGLEAPGGHTRFFRAWN